MFKDKNNRNWTSKSNYKKFESLRRRYFKTSLALEDYADDTNDNSIYTHPAFKILKRLRAEFDNLTEQEILNLAEQVVAGFDNILDSIGKDHFTLYDDGDINYIWQNH